MSVFKLAGLKALLRIFRLHSAAGPYDEVNDLECSFMKVNAAKQGLLLKFARPWEGSVSAFCSVPWWSSLFHVF